MQVTFTTVAVRHSVSGVAPLNTEYGCLTARAGRPSVGGRRTACSSPTAAKDGSSECSAPAVCPIAVREPPLRTEEYPSWLHAAAELTMPSGKLQGGASFLPRSLASQSASAVPWAHQTRLCPTARVPTSRRRSCCSYWAPLVQLLLLLRCVQCKVMLLRHIRLKHKPPANRALNRTLHSMPAFGLAFHASPNTVLLFRAG